MTQHSKAERRGLGRLLLFGGTFDPPHNGHLQMLQSCVAAVRPDRVLIVPTHLPPHKRAGSTPGPARLAMCRAAFVPRFAAAHVSTMELLRRGKSYSYDTVAALRRYCPETEIFLAVGSDMLLTLPSWHRYEQLKEMVTFVAQMRQKGEGAESEAKQFAQTLQAKGARVLFAEGPVQEISSTEIRELAAKGEDISALVPKEVLAIIQQRNLYRKGEAYRHDFKRRL